MEAIIGLIIAASLEHNIDPKLVLAIAQVESSMNPNAVSSKGAVGIMQLRPIAFPHIDPKRLKSLKVNIYTGVKHLVYMRDNCPFKYNYSWVVCYNRGVTGTIRDVQNPFRENYYHKVIREYNRLREL